MILGRFFGRGSKRRQTDSLVPLLSGIVAPLQSEARLEIDDAIGYIPDSAAQGRFMLTLMHVCLAAVLYRIQHAPEGRSGLASRFQDFAIAQWDRPPAQTLAQAQKLFAYSQRHVGDKLVDPDDDQLVEVGVFLLSIADPDTEQFARDAAYACGEAAHACWVAAEAETESNLVAYFSAPS